MRFLKTLRLSKTILILSLILCSAFSLATLASAQSSDLPDGLYAKMKTDKGDIVLRLFFKRAPITVSNFVGLAEGSKAWKDPIDGSSKKSHFYDGLIFHRVIANFMIQGGDPLGTGTGGPGFNFADEFHPELKHNKPGILSMANAGPGTNGSQFFITHRETPWLDGKHSVFGEVAEGMSVVNAIAKGDHIQKVEIVRVGTEAEAFDPSVVAAAQEEAARKLTLENKKKIPSSSGFGEIDPLRVPKAGQKPTDIAGFEMILINYKGARTTKANVYYDKEGARKVATQLVDIARRKGSNFMELVNQFTDLPQQHEIPMMRRRPQLPPFFQQGFLLKEGQISDALEMPMGFLILKRKHLELLTASHILISYDGAKGSTQKRSKAEAQQLALDLLKRIKAGEKFAVLAYKNSDDKSTAQKAGSLGTFARGMMVPAFENTAFTLKPGEVSDPVETQFGFHIILRMK